LLKTTLPGDITNFQTAIAGDDSELAAEEERRTKL